MPFHFSLNLHGRIGFNILLAVATIVGDASRPEVYIVADDARTPCSREKFRERAFPGLIGSQCPDECLAVESRYVSRSGYQGRARNGDRPLVGQVQTLARRQEPQVFRYSGLPQDLGQIGKATDLGPAAPWLVSGLPANC